MKQRLGFALLVALFLIRCTPSSQKNVAGTLLPSQTATMLQVTITPSALPTSQNGNSKNNGPDDKFWLVCGGGILLLALITFFLSYEQQKIIEQATRSIESIPVQDILKAREWKCLNNAVEEILKLVQDANSKLDRLKNTTERKRQKALLLEIEKEAELARTLCNSLCTKFDECQNLSEHLKSLITKVQQKNWGAFSHMVDVLLEDAKEDLRRAHQVSKYEEAKEILQSARNNLMQNLLQITSRDTPMNKQVIQIIRDSIVGTASLAGNNLMISITNREIIDRLVAELSRLLEELSRRQLTLEQEVDAFLVQKAYQEAKNKNLEKSRLYLLKAGSFVLDVAKEIAADIVIKFLAGSW
jgi:hypothetical protein